MRTAKGPQDYTYKRESDLRAAIRDNKALLRPYWVEAASGGTFGYPDVTLGPRGLKHIPRFYELKFGEWVKGEGNNSLLRFRVRPEQKKVLRSMAKDGFKVGLLIATGAPHKGLWYLPIERRYLAGTADLFDPNLVPICDWEEL